MAHKVIKKFREKFHKNTIYEVNDSYPKKGFKADPERVKALQSDANKYSEPFLEAEKKKEKETKKEASKK